MGEDSHFDDHILQMGWFNHQLEKGHKACAWLKVDFLRILPW